MIRGCSLWFFVLWMGVGAIFVQADESAVSGGHIGSALTRVKGSGYLAVEYVAANSPAAAAGIKKGDFIIAINGVSTKGESPAKALDSMQGEIGGVVKLTFYGEGSAAREATVVRKSLLDTYLPAATEGDASAEVYVAYYYEHTPPPIRDLAKAAAWNRKAAEQGYAPAQVNLAYLLRRGTGVPKDPVAAVAWDRKAANQGDAKGESGLAWSYLEGEGVQQSDTDAFAWFYSAARQDDPLAEQYLGLLYRKGRGVKRDDQSAFDWYYRSAQLHDFYGEWGLAYMYQHGLGVHKNEAEALQWYQQARVGLPDNEKLQRMTLDANLQAFLKNPDSAPLDLSLIGQAFRWQIRLFSLLLAAVYVIGGIVLFYFSLRAPDSPIKLSLAVGWLIFYLESQGLALLAILIFGKTLTADALVLVTSLFSALPVIGSSCGPLRIRIWRVSSASWKPLLLYAVAACLAIFMIDFVYDKIYAGIAHSSLPPQPTKILISSAKHESIWLAYACIAFALPLAEEIIFRGYLFDALQQRFSGKAVVVVTAFAFSLVHFQGAYFVPLFGCGLVLGWIRLKTASVHLPMILHVVNNGLFLALAL